MARHRNVIEAGDRYVIRHFDPATGEGVHRTQSRLVVGADHGPREFFAAVHQRRDHIRPTDSAVVTLPGRSDLDLGPGGDGLSLEHTRSGQVVGTVGTAGEVGEVAVAMLDHQVVDERAHAGAVVAADIDGFRRGPSGEGHDRDHVGQPGDLGFREHLVVEDQPIRLAGDGG